MRLKLRAARSDFAIVWISLPAFLIVIVTVSVLAFIIASSGKAGPDVRLLWLLAAAALGCVYVWVAYLL